MFALLPNHHIGGTFIEFNNLMTCASLIDRSFFFYFVLFLLCSYFNGSSVRELFSLILILVIRQKENEREKIFNSIGWVKIIRLIDVLSWMKFERMIVLSQQILEYANGLLIQVPICDLVNFIFDIIFIELRQAARDLHRLQSKYEPLTATTSDANNNNNNSTNASSVEQTRYLKYYNMCKLVSFLLSWYF